MKYKTLLILGGILLFQFPLDLHANPGPPHSTMSLIQKGQDVYISVSIVSEEFGFLTIVRKGTTSEVFIVRDKELLKDEALSGYCDYGHFWIKSASNAGGAFLMDGGIDAGMDGGIDGGMDGGVDGDADGDTDGDVDGKPCEDYGIEDCPCYVYYNFLIIDPCVPPDIYQYSFYEESSFDYGYSPEITVEDAGMHCVPPKYVAVGGSDSIVLGNKDSSGSCGCAVIGGESDTWLPAILMVLIGIAAWMRSRSASH